MTDTDDETEGLTARNWGDQTAGLPERTCSQCGRAGRITVVRIGGRDWCERCARRRWKKPREVETGIVGATPGIWTEY